jgi:hypothetical protein
VLTLTGSTITLDVEASDTIDNVKTKILEALGSIFTQPTDFTMLKGDEPLEGGRTLGYYNIPNEAMLNMLSTVAAVDIPVPSLDRLTIFCLFLFIPITKI